MNSAAGRNDPCCCRCHHALMARAKQTSRLKTAPSALEKATARLRAERAAASTAAAAEASDEEQLTFGTGATEQSAMADSEEEPLSPKSAVLAQFAATTQVALDTVVAASETLAANLTAAQELSSKDPANLQARLTEVERELERSQQVATAAETAQKGLKEQLADLKSQLESEIKRRAIAEGEQGALEKQNIELLRAKGQLEVQLEQARELKRDTEQQLDEAIKELRQLLTDKHGAKQDPQQLAAKVGILLVNLNRLLGQQSEEDRATAVQEGDSAAAAAAAAAGGLEPQHSMEPAGAEQQPSQIPTKKRPRVDAKPTTGGEKVPATEGKSPAARSSGKVVQLKAESSPKSNKAGSPTSQPQNKPRGRSPERGDGSRRRGDPSSCRSEGRDHRSHSRGRSRSPAAPRGKAAAGCDTRTEPNRTRQREPPADKEERSRGRSPTPHRNHDDGREDRRRSRSRDHYHRGSSSCHKDEPWSPGRNRYHTPARDPTYHESEPYRSFHEPRDRYPLSAEEREYARRREDEAYRKGREDERRQMAPAPQQQPGRGRGRGRGGGGRGNGGGQDRGRDGYNKGGAPPRGGGQYGRR